MTTLYLFPTSKEAEGLLGDARGNIMAAASLILNEEVDKTTKEDRP